ncbi:MAG: PD-(D/E)XK nuclease family protein [Alistipes sp.]
MRGFLREVAEDLYGRYGAEISSFSFLFPSRRARLFFVDALSEIADRPMWQPEWVTIADLMGEGSELKSGDRVRLITELYKVYSRYHNEPFDKFYFWGEMLLTDFDLIDKYRIDADMLFRNISEIKEIEADISYLTPAQLQILSFWGSFGEETTLSDEKRKFLAIWKTLASIYHQFKAHLTELGIAYDGMIQRVAAEKMQQPGFRFVRQRHYVVVGFNALSECEKQLFKRLSTTTETDFYWDYDTYYKDHTEQEAGMFVRDNVSTFPPRAEISHDNMRAPKEVTVASTASNAVQCKYVATILSQLSAHAPLDKETAIVLTDENLLLPLLYALPEKCGKVNVTMGYPLRQSLAYSFVERLIGLQHHSRTKGDKTTFYHADVLGILAHPYLSESDPKQIKMLQEEIVRNRRISIDATQLCKNELLSRVFHAAPEWREESRYLLDIIASVARLPYEGDDARQRVEFLAVIAENLTKLHNSLDLCEVDLTADIYNSLVRRYLQTLRIPFEGEPLKGIQVMGILETRNLDFKNVIILSMNDDNFPGNHTTQASFVPYNLRAAYGLPTPEHHEGVFAYYFYRLIQRAETVHLLYCSHADDKTTGEPSRYIYQLDYESAFDLHKIEVGVDVNLAETPPIQVDKKETVMRKLSRFLDVENQATLSPTAFFRYVACPLRFYFHSVARLEADDEIAEDVDAPMFGTILHAAVHQLYKRIEGEQHPAQTLRALLRTGEVERAVEAAINENYLQQADAAVEDYTGNLLLVKDIVTKYIRGGIIPYDAAHDDFVVVGLEQKVEYSFPFAIGDKALCVKFAGVADRIDSLSDGSLRVVDYKTGSATLEFNGVTALFNGKGKQRQSNILQTLLYSMMLHHSQQRDVVPALYYVRNINNKNYSPQLVDKELKTTGGSYALYRESVEDLLRTKLSELFDASVPFVQCEDTDTCQYCDFKEICKR